MRRNVGNPLIESLDRLDDILGCGFLLRCAFLAMFRRQLEAVGLLFDACDGLDEFLNQGLQGVRSE